MFHAPAAPAAQVQVVQFSAGELRDLGIGGDAAERLSRRSGVAQAVALRRMLRLPARPTGGSLMVSVDGGMNVLTVGSAGR